VGMAKVCLENEVVNIWGEKKKINPKKKMD
jgi:hypothetical protein